MKEQFVSTFCDAFAAVVHSHAAECRCPVVDRSEIGAAIQTTDVSRATAVRFINLTVWT